MKVEYIIKALPACLDREGMGGAARALRAAIAIADARIEGTSTHALRMLDEKVALDEKIGRETWFAWYPVCDGVHWYWLERVERMRMANQCDSWWAYRA